MSLQMLVLLVPVFFGLMGFGLDLGRLYLVRGELNHAAEAMALAAAEKLAGTEASLDDAGRAARLALDNATGFGNKYNFGSIPIGESTGTLTSTVPDPVYFETAADAVSDESAGGAGGTTAKYVRVDLTADAPLLFWGMLALGQERRTPVMARAAAGISAPLCTACGIEPFAIAALSPDDTIDFGFVPGTKYTLGYPCNPPGGPPGALPGTTQRINYLIVNRYNDTSALEENQQLYRIGAQGLLPSSTAAQACISISAEEMLWATATPSACNQQTVTASVRAAFCGLTTRFEATPPAGCGAVTDVENLALSYTPDTFVEDLDEYAGYTGNGRRIITIPIVDTLSTTAAMVVLGFRQFLALPGQADVMIAAGDQNARFGAMYIGSVAPVKQGRFDGCTITSGPGKVVLHR
ncbi:MAG: pilus assembly protein TadG-related protein [Bryobacteraceae bacterium]